MGRQARLMAAVLAAKLVLGASFVRAQSGAAGSANPEISQLQQEIAAMQAKVDRLQTEEEQKQLAATQQAVLQDADEHDKATELGTGYDPKVGFVIRSPDGAFSLHPGALFDFREMTSVRTRIPSVTTNQLPDVDTPGITGSDTQSGFDATRVRLTFDGNYTKAFNYFIQFQDDQGQTFNLYDAYGVLKVGNSPFSVKFGQFKDPVYHERMLSEVNLMAVDRSLLESFYGGGNSSRVQGVSLMYDKDQFRGQIAFHDGYNSINTKFFDSASGVSPLASTLDNVAPNFGVSGRLEYLAIGDRTKDFNPFSEYDGGFTALGDTENILVVGGGFDYTQAGRNSGFYHTVDAQYDNTDGLSLYGAYLGSYRTFPKAIATAATPVTSLAPVFNYGVATPGNYYDPGFLLQAGYLVTPDIEPFVRYDYTYFANGSVVIANPANSKLPGPRINRTDAQEFTAGVNYYIYKQHLKFTVDGSFLPNGAPVDQDAMGVLANNGHNEFILRVQFQVAL